MPNGNVGPWHHILIPKVSLSVSAIEMAAVSAEETAALGSGSDAPPGETNQGNAEKKENGLPEPETKEAGSSVEPKMEEVDDAEAGEEKPAAAADKAAGDEATDDGALAVTQEAPAACEEPEERAESRPRLEDGNNEHAGDDTIKDAKEEPDDDSRCSGIDSEKSTTVCEDGDKPSGGGGEMGDKRRTSVEISSSDGEPLSRMDSEDRSVGEQVVMSRLVTINPFFYEFKYF